MRPGETLPPLQLLLPAALAAVEQARAAVLRHLEPLRLAPRTVHALELVLEETVMNIATHGYGAGDEGTIELTLAVDAQRLTLRFVDDGVAFDPSRAVPSARPATIAQAQPGGLGLALVRRHAREIAYERHDGSNRLTVVLDRA
jgi:anti-sigma regulatory factor (Ser/Thr protein kinase)